MRCMILIKANKDSEAGQFPDEPFMTEMGNYNEELVKAGIMLDGEGLHPSVKGKRVAFSGGRVRVVDGPFTETKELLAGYWIWKVTSIDEAVEWVKRCPMPKGAPDGEIEIRPIFELEEFGEALTPEQRAQEDRLRTELQQRKEK